MGTVGCSVLNDDLAFDVISSFEKNLKEGFSFPETTKRVVEEYSDSRNAEDEGPIFWLVLAEVHWRYGYHDEKITKIVMDDFLQEKGISRLKENGGTYLEQRKKAIAALIQKLEKPNSKPRKIPKIANRKPIFEVGYCISILLPNGFYGAAIVLKSDYSDVEYGKNLIATLTYYSKFPPTQEIFKKRDWLFLTHHSWAGQMDFSWYLPGAFKKFRKNFSVVCTTNFFRRIPRFRFFLRGTASWSTGNAAK